MTKRKRRPFTLVRRLVLAVVITTALTAGWWLWYSNRDYGALFLRQKGALKLCTSATVTVTPCTTVYDLSLTSDNGLQTQARMRTPNRDGRFPGVLIASGLETGRQVIDLLEERDDLVAMSIDYNWEGTFDVSSFRKFWRTLWRMRPVCMEATPRLLLAVDALAADPKVHSNRIVMVGVSYGAYAALSTAALDQRICETILVQGGGEMQQVLNAVSKRWQTPLPPSVVGWSCATIFLPLKPELWIGKIAPRPVTFVASRADADFPPAAVEEIFARAGEPKKLIWHDTQHVNPDAREIIAELSRIVLEQLGKGQELK